MHYNFDVLPVSFLRPLLTPYHGRSYEATGCCQKTPVHAHMTVPHRRLADPPLATFGAWVRIDPATAQLKWAGLNTTHRPWPSLPPFLSLGPLTSPIAITKYTGFANSRACCLRALGPRTRARFYFFLTYRRFFFFAFFTV